MVTGRERIPQLIHSQEFLEVESPRKYMSCLSSDQKNKDKQNISGTYTLQGKTLNTKLIPD
jgi:hypothetical protein